MQRALQDTRDAAREEQDSESRRNNIIMYRVLEVTLFWQETEIWETKDFVSNFLL